MPDNQSAARTFDALQASNRDLIRTIRVGTTIVVLMMAAMTAFLRAGQLGVERALADGQMQVKNAILTGQSNITAELNERCKQH